jgi:hypothetical protein
MFAAAAIATLAGGAQLVGCGDDSNDDQTSPPSIDAGIEPNDGAVTQGPAITVSGARAKIYLGQTAKIDGASVAAGITTDISWTVLTAPFGSTITAASLQDATTASPTFKPDLLGGYTLQINGRKDGAPASVIVFIEAIDAPIFWREGHVTGSQNFSADESVAVTTHVGGVYGAGDRAVNCAPDAGFDPDGGVDPSSSLQLAVYGARLSASGGDMWEAPPGSPSRVVFVDSTVVGTLPQTSLSVATSQSSCGSPDSKSIETLTMDAGAGGIIPALSLVENARFSPSGDRIAYLHDVDGKARLSTIAFDGSAKRELAPFYATGSDAGGLDPDAGIMPFSGGAGPLPMGQLTARWKDETHVGWITFVGPDAIQVDRSEWELYVVEDSAGATASRVMHCAASGPTSFDFLPDGTIVAATRHVVSTSGGDQTPMDLLVYRANATTGECEIVRNLTNNTTSDAIARDLALSPDKSQIAFFSGFGTGFALDPNNNLGLFTVPVDGSHAAAQVPGTARAADPGIGPRWVAGGTAITWGQVDAVQGAPGSAGHQVSIPAGGGTPRTVVTGSVIQVPDGDGGTTVDYRVTYGIGQGCGVSRGPLSGGLMAAGGALGFAALVARRRRRAPKA